MVSNGEVGGGGGRGCNKVHEDVVRLIYLYLGKHESFSAFQPWSIIDGHTVGIETIYKKSQAPFL